MLFELESKSQKVLISRKMMVDISLSIFPFSVVPLNASVNRSPRDSLSIHIWHEKVNI